MSIIVSLPIIGIDMGHTFSIGWAIVLFVCLFLKLLICSVYVLSNKYMAFYKTYH